MLTQAIPGREGLTPRQLWPAILGSVAVLFLIAAPLAGVGGVMKYLVIAMAVWIAVLVFQNPKEAISAGILFILAANVLLPSSARFEWSWQTAEPWELYYHATGLLIITLAAVLRLGPRALLRVPASVKVFFLVASAAALVGFSNGNSPSYVIRQFYGSLLLVLYFAMAYQAGDEQLFLRRLRTFGVLCAAGFFVYYAAVFSEYGFHKEMTAAGTLCGAVAILCFVTGTTEKRISWITSAFILLGVPLLLVERRIILTFVLGVTLALAMKASTRKMKLFLYSAAVLVMLPGILPSSAAILVERLISVPALEKILPAEAIDVNTLVDRALELPVAAATLQKSPILGNGFGSEITWDSPTLGLMEQAYVDNGWGYLMVKMGGAGILVFSWFLWTILGSISRESLAISVCFLSMLLVTLFSEPVFFQFTTSPLLGTLAGLLYARKARETNHGLLTASLSKNRSRMRIEGQGT
jgi:hypothetical protein